jgi:hypothetical protein
MGQGKEEVEEEQENADFKERVKEEKNNEAIDEKEVLAEVWERKEENKVVEELEEAVLAISSGFSEIDNCCLVGDYFSF